MGARVVEVRNGLREKIDAYWTVRSDEDNDEVIGRWLFDIASETLLGRKVIIVPVSYLTGVANRTEDRGDYQLVVVVVERYTEQGPATDEWVDDRVMWCELLMTHITDPRAAKLLATNDEDGLWPDVSDVLVYDVEELTQRKLFLSVITVTFREER